jgi:hypothetical protein
MPFLRHIGPVGGSWLVWLIKAVVLSQDSHFAWGPVLEMTLWAELSLVVSCGWRVFTDDRTLATADVPHTGFTRFLLHVEQVACFLLFVLVLTVAARGTEKCLHHWTGFTLFFVYFVVMAYFLAGYFIHSSYHKDTETFQLLQSPK